MPVMDYVNWQWSADGTLLCVVMQRRIGAHPITHLVRFNAMGSALFALPDGLSLVEIIERLRGYGFTPERTSVLHFVSDGDWEFFRSATRSDRETISSSRPSFVPDGAVRAPCRTMRTSFRGEAYERWSHNLGKFVSCEQLHYPLKVNVDITRRCDLRCSYCYLEPGDTGSDLSLEHIDILLDACAAARIQVVNLFGGEPLLHGDIVAILEHIAARGMRAVINTNGLHLSPEVLRACHACNVASLHISIDAADRKLYECLRPGGTFRRVLTHVRRAVRSGIPVQLNCTVTRRNVLRIPAVWWLARRLGVAVVSIGPFHAVGSGRAHQSALRVPPLFLAVWARLLQCVLRSPQTVLYVKNRCDANSYMHIDSTGRCHYCSQIPRSFPLGDALRRPLMQIWRDDAYVKIFDRTSLKDPCKACLFGKTYCNAWRCRVEPAATHDDLFAGHGGCIRGKISCCILAALSWMGVAV